MVDIGLYKIRCDKHCNAVAVNLFLPREGVRLPYHKYNLIKGRGGGRFFFIFGRRGIRWFSADATSLPPPRLTSCFLFVQLSSRLTLGAEIIIIITYSRRRKFDVLRGVALKRSESIRGCPICLPRHFDWHSIKSALY